MSFALFAQSSIVPIPQNVAYNQVKAELGKKLFFDPLLSKDGTLSCSSCHTLPGNGANSSQFSFGINGSENEINTPTVLNSTFNFSHFFNGRAKNLQDQALESIESPYAMQADINEVLTKLQSTEYKGEFARIYDDGLNKKNLLDAITVFERALTTPNSRFDQYLRGDTTALNKQEKDGYERFVKDGCISCHNGVNIGGNMYQKMGIYVPYGQEKVLNGRYDITKRERDKYVYKVPSLRNIELTAPYFHDGSVKTLKEAIVKMYEHQLGVPNKKKGVEDVEAFLKTLTGEAPKILQEKVKGENLTFDSANIKGVK